MVGNFSRRFLKKTLLIRFMLTDFKKVWWKIDNNDAKIMSFWSATVLGREGSNFLKKSIESCNEILLRWKDNAL